DPEHLPSREPADRARTPTHILQGPAGPAHPLRGSSGRAAIPPSDSADGGGRHQTQGGGTALQHTTLGPEKVPACRGSQAAACSRPRRIPIRTPRAPFPSRAPGTPFPVPDSPPAARRGSARASRDRRARSWGSVSVSCPRHSPLLQRVRCFRVTAAWGPRPPAPPAAEMMCGAPTATQPATADIQAIADRVRSQLEEKEKKFPMFKAVEFKSQVVAGMVFFIKVQVDEDNFVHIRAFESLPHERKPLALVGYQTHKGRHDELTYF
uniref:Cystatin domain-containing protein n=3 Tax=Balaenoptera TaxID=9766 RepID=A0A8C0CPK1_BALMU